jgi:hypothetical protein
MIYLSNAFSLQMIDTSRAQNIHIAPVSVEQVQEILTRGFVSVIGHADTAKILESMLHTGVAYNRANLKLQQGDILIVAQVMGGRLPEGTTEIPAGISIIFLKVEYLKRPQNI